MIIDVTYDASVNTCPNEAAFKACVAGVVNFFETQFTNPITINWDLGWGEVDGQAIAGGSGAASISNYTNDTFTYAQIRNALASHATSADDKTALASLPTTDPTGGAGFSVTYGEGKALGLVSANATGIDGWSGLDTTSAWVYNTTNTSGANVGQNGSDAFSFLAHELSEVMGRQMDFNSATGVGGGYYPYDLFDYKANGVRSLASSATADRYFSIDDGKTNTGLHYFNNDGAGGDLFDYLPNGTAGSYQPTGVADSFDYSGSVGLVSAADLRLMDVLGYNPTPNFTWASQVSGSFAAAADWTAGVTPGVTNSAILDAPGTTAYTVTSATTEIVNYLQTASTATLAITGGIFETKRGTGTGVSAGSITVAKGSTFVTYGALDNTGALTTSGGLYIEAAVSGTGVVTIAGGAAVFASTFAQNVSFTAASGELMLFQSQGYTGTITGFSKANTDVLDLRDIKFSTATGSYAGTATSGVLTISDGTDTAHIHLSGSYVGVAVHLRTDSAGGTVVSLGSAGKAAQPAAASASHAFVTAMASFGASASASLGAPSETSHIPLTMLVSPGMRSL